MEIDLYKLNCQENRIDKSNGLTSVKILQGTFRTPTSLRDPIIDIETLGLSDLGHTTVYADIRGNTVSTADGIIYTLEDSSSDAVSILSFDYLYIPSLKRYYFVRDITLLSNHLSRLTCHLDVLYTFKDYIKKCYARIVRSDQYLPSALLDDPLITFSDQANEIFTEFENGYAKGVYAPDIKPTVSLTFIDSVSTIPLILDSVVINTSKARSHQYPDYSSYLHTYVGSAVGLISTFTHLLRIKENGIMTASVEDKLVVSGSKLGTYFRSSIAYPIKNDDFLDISSSSFSSDVVQSYDGTDLTGIYVYNSGPSQYSYKYTTGKSSAPMCLGAFKVPPLTSVIDLHSKLEIYIPFEGWHEIDQKTLGGKSIGIFYIINWDEPTATVLLANLTDGVVIYSNRCTIGLQLDLLSTNEDAIGIQKTANTLGFIMKLAGSAATVAGSVITANPLGVGAGILSGVNATASYATSMASLYPTASINPGTEAGSYLSASKPLLKKIQQRFSSQYVYQYGSPNGSFNMLSQFTKGFLLCDHVTHPDDTSSLSVTPMKDDISEIDGLLQSGVFVA